MKKKIAFLPLLILSTISSTSCSVSSNKFNPTFGSEIDTTFTNLSYSELYKKVNDHENMIVVTYPGKDTHCSCWKTMENVLLPKLAKETEYLVYAVDAFEIDRSTDKFSLVVDLASPSIVFFKEGKKYDQYVYSIRNTQDFFKKYDALVKLLEDKTSKPQYIYTDVQGIKNGIKNEEEYIIQYTYSSCPDCSYCLPNVMYPYLSKNKLSNQIHIVDLEKEENFLTEGKIDSKNAEYISFKKEMGLSKEGNSDFGYNTGYVPTIQYYKNGTLTSASVFFNDTIEEVNGVYKITSSFYSQERLSKLEYASNVTNNVLEGLEIPLSDLTIYEEYNYIAWNQDAASAYHKPLLEAFLNKYAK